MISMGRRAGWIVSVTSLPVALAIAACGSTATSPPSTPAATATPTAGVPTGPVTAQLTAVGTGGLSGAFTVQSVNCSFPGVDGPGILIFGTPPAAGVSIRIVVQATKVDVVADAGAGAQFSAREFVGTGVTGFDAARGALLSGPLTETTSGSPAGSLGTVTSISGTVHCNNQQPGSSTVMLTGSTAAGALSGGLRSVNVKCTGSTGALTLALVTAGTTPELVDLFGGLQSGKPTVSLLLVAKGTTTTQHYAATGPAVATVSANGVHFNADIVEDAVAGATPHTLHVSGDVVCGSSVAP